MQLHQNYFGAYRGLKLAREDNGVLVVEFHSNGGPCTFSALHHTEVVDAFHRIAQDRANKIVILTGAGGDFIIGVDWSSFGDVSDPGVWSQIHDEGGKPGPARFARQPTRCLPTLLHSASTSSTDSTINTWATGRRTFRDSLIPAGQIVRTFSLNI
jgi:enoyl-CoA hydratase/carnithine racemase